MGLESRKAVAEDPVRVLHVASGDLWGGAEAMVAELLEAARKGGRQWVHAVLLNEGRLADSLRSADITVTVLEESELSFRQLLSRLIQVQDSFVPHVVHTHRRKENLLGAIAAARRGIPSVRTIHGGWEFVPEHWDWIGRLKVVADQWVARRLQAYCVAVSEELQTRADILLPGARTVMIHNGIDVAKAIATAREEPAPPWPVDDDPVVCFAGRLVPVKRVDRILDAFKIACNLSHPQPRLVILGDGCLRESLEQRAEQLGIAARTHFLGFRPDSLACIARARVMVLASEHEGLPMTALEAIALDTPVVATAVGGLPALIESSGFGRICESEPASIANGIVDMLRGPTPPITSGGHLPRPYRIESVVERYESLYMRACGRTALEHGQHD